MTRIGLNCPTFAQTKTQPIHAHKTTGYAPLQSNRYVSLAFIAVKSPRPKCLIDLGDLQEGRLKITPRPHFQVPHFSSIPHG